MLNQSEENFIEGDVFRFFYNNDLVKSLSNNMSEKNDAILFFRFFRAGITGQTLYDESLLKMKELDRIALEHLGCLCELYIFYLRSIYDHLLKFIKKHSKEDLPRSFNEFLKKVKNDKYVGVSKEFKKMVSGTGFSFEELRNLRDSIKEKFSVVFPYINEEGKIFIKVEVYGRDKKQKKTIDEELSFFVYRQAMSIWYLTILISEEIGLTEKNILKI